MNEIGTYMEIPKEQISANSYNPNEMTDDDEQRLKTSMSRNGMLQTILVYKRGEDDYVIVDGEHRWKVAPPESKVRAIVIDDDDIEVIRDNLSIKEGIVANTKEDVLKHLTVIINKLRGTMTPMKLADLIESLQVEETKKASLMLMDEAEIETYSLLDEIEEEKQKIIEKEVNFDKAELVSGILKSIKGLVDVQFDIKDRKFFYDGDEFELEGATITISKNYQAKANIRYRHLVNDDDTEEFVDNIKNEDTIDEQDGQDSNRTIEEDTDEETSD
jgi:hypothetical protein